VAEVGVFARIAAPGFDDQRASNGVDVLDALHRPGAAGDLAQELAGVQVVGVELGPVVALRRPEDLVRSPQDPPPGHRLELGVRRLLEQGAHVAGGGVGDVHRGALVVARRAHVGEP
jgi:hypothetical protein